jgi:hypothetical protein
VARISCAAVAGPFESPVGAGVSFPLAVLTLNAVDYGLDTMTISGYVAGQFAQLGSCNPVTQVEMCEEDTSIRTDALHPLPPAPTSF